LGEHSVDQLKFDQQKLDQQKLDQQKLDQLSHLTGFFDN